jgi:hypothetical protein
MRPPQKRTAAETWKALEALGEDEAAEREMDRVLALPAQEIDRELAQLGIDPAASRARGDQVARHVAREFAQPGIDPAASRARGDPAPFGVRGPASLRARPERRSRAAIALVAAALAAMVVATWGGVGEKIARWLHPPAPVLLPHAPSPEWLASERDRVHARDLRGAAHVDCASSRWLSCLHGLDEARALDPAGDEEPAAQEDRRAATGALSAPRAPVNEKP